MAYTKPPASSMPFKFTEFGYVKPDADNVDFKFSDFSTTNLQAAINVLSQDYIKECPTYTIIYNGKVQIIHLPCIYSGFRDVGGYIYGNPTYADLGAYIKVLEGEANLGAYILSTIQAYKNLGARLVPLTRSAYDLIGYIIGPTQDAKDIGGIIDAFDTINLQGIIDTHPPFDIQGLINIIEIEDLPGTITGEYYKGQKDLGAGFYKIWDRKYKDLAAILTCDIHKNLQALITVFQYRDLEGIIDAFDFVNLPANLYSILPYDLPALIHGWAIKDLGAYLIGVYGDGDVQASIIAIPPSNLPAYINVFQELESIYNLKGIIEGWNTSDIGAFLNTIQPIDLGAIINSSGGSKDLLAYIIPKTILLRKALLIPLLEYANLNATINFACFGSGYKELGALLHPLYKHDLRANVIGWYGNYAYNLRDFGAYINTSNHDVQDKFIPKFIPEVQKYTKLDIKFSAESKYNVVDKLYVKFGTFYGKDLTASIVGFYNSIDLGAQISPITQANYSGLPDNIKPKSHEVVVKLTEKGKNIQWRRMVELMFEYNTNTFKYFYVSGESKVYKNDRSNNWIISATSYKEIEDSFVERNSVRRKFLFNLDKYATIDEAVRDLIDKVSFYREQNLGAKICGELPLHFDLQGILSITMKYSWVDFLRGSVIGRLRGYKGTETLDISAEITGT